MRNGLDVTNVNMTDFQISDLSIIIPSSADLRLALVSSTGQGSAFLELIEFISLSVGRRQNLEFDLEPIFEFDCKKIQGQQLRQQLDQSGWHPEAIESEITSGNSYFRTKIVSTISIDVISADIVLYS